MVTQVTPPKAPGKEDPENDGSTTAKATSDAATKEATPAVPEGKKEDDKQSSAPTNIASSSETPKKTSSPTDSVLAVNMPNSIVTPSNRPPSRSSLSVASAGSASGRTTTSRRGGRTRSRSPTAGHNVHAPYGGRPPSTTPSVPSEVAHLGNSSVPPSPRNPSAAAAAAAAAAKSFRSPSARPSSGSSMHPSAMHYQQPPYGGGPSSMRDPYGRQGPQGRQDPYSSRYPGGPPIGQRQPQQRPPSSTSTSYPGQPPLQSQRPHSRSSASYPGGPPPPGYYDPHGSRNPSSSSHHPYHQQHPRSGSRAGPSVGSRYDSQGVGPDGRPLSRNGGGDPQNPYGYNPYHRSSGAPASSRGGIPPGSGREYASQYPGSTSSSSGGRYGGPPGGGQGSSGPVDSGEYGRQHHSGSTARRTPPPHHRHQYPGGGPPGHHPQGASSSRGGRQPYPGSSSTSTSHQQPSYRHGDPNARGAPPPHYRGGPPISTRGGPPPGHPDYHRYHSQQQQQHKQQKGGESMAKSTRTVMGTATPLHLNKGGPLLPVFPQPGPPKPGSSYHNASSSKNNSNSNGNRRDSVQTSSRRGTAASVFRGRPGPEESHSGGASGSNNNPKSILDSLDTPSNSFDEKKSSRAEGKAKDSVQLSPDAPPKLRSSGSNAAGATGNSDLVFDPQRSPKSQATGPAGLAMSPPQLTNSIDMAPSFSLFNQSFDSLGDTAQFFNVSGALDSTMLNSSTSFELVKTSSPSSSQDNPLQLSASSGTFKLNASMSGGNIFGMSPTNSFGNGPTASFSINTTGGPGGSLTVLGGNSDNGRSASPSQVLDLYKSAGSIEEADLRLSASLCSPMIGATPNSYSSSRPFATAMEGGPPQPSLGNTTSNRRSHLSPRPQRRYSGHGSYRPQRASSIGPPNKDGSPRFYNFLRNNSDAFSEVTFLLPELKKALMNSKKNAKKEGNDGLISNENTPKRGQSSRSRGSRYNRMQTDAEIAIARRRIASAVCAFGGTFVGNRMVNPTPVPDASTSSSKTGLSKSDSRSIFREKSSEPATVTPNSSGSSSTTPAAEGKEGVKISPEQAKYDGALPTRYYESDNRLSWEFEENPPIETREKGPDDYTWCEEVSEESPNKKRKKDDNKCTNYQSEDDDNTEEGGDSSKKSKDGKVDSQKLRYRCKLCGQPKTDHVCPYKQSLVRSIGVEVKPAVNAFTAAEPGLLAPDLKEMNNMAISIAAVNAENNSADNTLSSRPTPDRSSTRRSASRIEGDAVTSAAAQVTPESLRSMGGSTRGQDHPMSPGGRSPVSPGARSRVGTPGTSTSSRRGGRAGTPGSTPGKKRSHARMNGGNAGDPSDLLFVEEMELKSEQYRTVTPSKQVTGNLDAFTYPALPLPYAQRKRLSDNLFSLSKEIPQLTDECAAVLRVARERDLWDLAVAELMTQVVVVVHCYEGDACFEGLSRYLLTLGFTC